MLVLTSSQSDLCLCCSLAAGTFYTNRTEIKISRSYHTMNFSKDVLLKSTVELASPHPNHIILLKKLLQTFALLLFPWPVSSLAGVFMMRWHTPMCVLIESLRWADACSDREPSLGNIAWDNKTLLKKKLTKHKPVSAMQVCAYRMCVTL